MSTPNFYNDSYFDLYVAADEDCDFIDDSSLSEALREAEKKLNRELLFFDVSLKSGYYEGVQLFIEENQNCKNYGNPEEQDNEGCRYFWDLCRSKAIRSYKSEKKWINRELLPFVAKYLGMRKLLCRGVFSNGEAVYEWAK